MADPSFTPDEASNLLASLSHTLARGDAILSEVYETLAALDRLAGTPSTAASARKKPR